MTAQTHNASEDGPEATGTVLSGHKSLGENMSETTISDREQKRIDHVVSALAALERIHGTRALCQGIERFEKDKDFGERRWSAMPERRARMEEYARLIAEADGREYPELTRPVLAEPFPPVEETRLYQLAREVAAEPGADDPFGDVPLSAKARALAQEFGREQERIGKAHVAMMEKRIAARQADQAGH